MPDTNAARLLDINQKNETSYCVPLWLRDEQIKVAISRVKQRIEGTGVRRKDPVAVVCYGPSLNQTWEYVKKFKYIITGSGSHKFLLDKGVVPPADGKWFHLEVDPRAHKVDLMGTPHKDIEYLIASTCSPKVFDHLKVPERKTDPEGPYTVKLWHVFDSDAEGQRMLPPGEWAVTGGANVGLRQITMAYFLGFTDVHVFGLDGSIGEDGGSHAAAHPNAAKGFALCEYPPGSGKMWKTQQNYLECAKATFHELDQLPEVDATFYGRGLVQEMAKNYKRKKIDVALPAALQKAELITPAYRELNAKLHREEMAYGVGGSKHTETVMQLVTDARKSLNNPNLSVLDYGAGKGLLAKSLPFPIWEYDPAVEGKTETPRPADLVICTDVLEHIEPEKIDDVLADLRRCVKAIGFFVIHTGPAQKVLTDGRNAHILQRDRVWWKSKLRRHFTLLPNSVTEKGPLLFVVVSPKEAPKPKDIKAWAASVLAAGQPKKP